MPKLKVVPNGVVGIDPSLKSAAIVSGRNNSMTLCAGGPDKKLFGRIARWMAHADAVVEVVAKANPQLVLIEGYSFGSFGNVTLDLAEFGGMLRERLLRRFPKVLEVSPKTLKKFCTGNGNAKKAEVMVCLRRDWGVEFETNDEFDAFGLWLMGMAMLGRLVGNVSYEQGELVAKFQKENQYC